MIFLEVRLHTACWLSCEYHLINESLKDISLLLYKIRCIFVFYHFKILIMHSLYEKKTKPEETGVIL